VRLTAEEHDIAEELTARLKGIASRVAALEDATHGQPTVDESEIASAPVATILATIDERGLDWGTEAETFERFADLAPSDLLVALWHCSSEAITFAQRAEERMERVETLATILAERAEPNAYRRSLALRDPTFTWNDPQPIVAA